MRAIVAAPVSGGDEGGGDALHVFAVDAEAVAGVFVVQPVEDGRGVEAAVDEGVAAGKGAPQVFCRVFGNADEARGQAVAVVVATGREGGAQGGLCGGGVGQVDVDVGEAAAGVGVQPGDDVAAQGFALALQAVAAVDAQAVVLWCLVVRVCRCAVFTPPPRPSPALQGRGKGGCGKAGGNVVFFEFADFGLQGGEEVVRRGGRGREWFGVAVGVEEAGEVALLFAVAGEEFVSVFAVLASWFSGGTRFEFAQPAAVNDVVDVAVAGGEVVVGEVGVVAEVAHEVVFGGVQVGWREDGDVRRQQAARAFAGFECLPEGFAAAFAFGMDGGEAVVPEAALLLVEGAVVVGDLGGQLLQAVVFEEGVQRWRIGVLPGAQPFGALVEVGAVEVGELAAVYPEATGVVVGDCVGVGVEAAQQGVLWVAGVGEDGVAVLVEVAE